MRIILIFVFLIVGLGFFLQSGVTLPFLGWVGHLPGDIIIQKEDVTIFFPLTTSLLISILLTFLFHKAKPRKKDD